MAWTSGTEIGPYTIIDELGQGGMARVYRARHRELDRTVAIKIMHQNSRANEALTARFNREAQIIARLEHPHIVPVYDYNWFEQQPYLVMKVIDGHTLKARMQQGSLSDAEILAILTPVADALDYAHGNGVLHRDIKPSNIVITVNGHPYLTDFGLARLAASGESSLSSDVLLGTPNYISPEQGSGERALDNRTDLYSLGIVLYELFAGEVPFKGDTAFSIIHDHIYKPIPLPSTKNENISRDVEAVILKATAKRPEDRYASAGEMMAELSQALNKNTTKIETSHRQAEDKVQRLPTPPGITDTIVHFEKAQTTIGSVPDTVKSEKSWFPLSAVAGIALVVLIAIGLIAGLASTTKPEPFAIERIPGSNPAILDIPIVPLREAEALVADQPSDPAYHLVLARAYWEAGQNENAYRSIWRGATVSGEENAAIYFLNASYLASEIGQSSAAISYGVLALHRAQNQSDLLLPMRETAGRILYEESRFNGDMRSELSETMSSVLGVGILSDTDLRDLAGTTPALVVAAGTRLATNEPARALFWLNRIPSKDQNLAEVHLVRGEIFSAQSNLVRAQNEWRFVLADPDAPQWTRDRASVLLNEQENSS